MQHVANTPGRCLSGERSFIALSSNHFVTLWEKFPPLAKRLEEEPEDLIGEGEEGKRLLSSYWEIAA
jgi:hypothetical protein